MRQIARDIDIEHGPNSGCHDLGLNLAERALKDFDELKWRVPTREKQAHEDRRHTELKKERMRERAKQCEQGTHGLSVKSRHQHYTAELWEACRAKLNRKWTRKRLPYDHEVFARQALSHVTQEILVIERLPHWIRDHFMGCSKMRQERCEEVAGRIETRKEHELHGAVMSRFRSFDEVKWLKTPASRQSHALRGPAVASATRASVRCYETLS